MTLKSLISKISNFGSRSTSSSSVKPTTSRKPFTKHRPESSSEIDVLGNTEVEAGRYYPDEKDIIDEAVTKGLKAEKLG